MAQDAHREIIREKLQADLEAVIDNYEGVAGVHIIDLSNGDRWGYCFGVRNQHLDSCGNASK
jgi:hypothetical protein